MLHLIQGCGERILKFCFKFMKDIILNDIQCLCSSGCGQSKYNNAGGLNQRIDGGQESRPNEFPWQVGLALRPFLSTCLFGHDLLHSECLTIVIVWDN